MGLAFRVLSEFVAAVIVGAFIGWWIDRVAGTTPAFVVVFPHGSGSGVLERLSHCHEAS